MTEETLRLEIPGTGLAFEARKYPGGDYPGISLYLMLGDEESEACRLEFDTSGKTANILAWGNGEPGTPAYDGEPVAMVKLDDKGVREFLMLDD